MNEPAQPPDEPYEVGDRVRVRLSAEGVDSPFEGTVCRVAHVFTRQPEEHTAADTDVDLEVDRASYRLEDVESGDTLPAVLRHRDLVPAADAKRS